jgi:YVTN family beta-propeller protein
MSQPILRRLMPICFAASALLHMPTAAAQPNSGQPQVLSTNQTITPLAPRGATFQPLNPKLSDNPGYTVGQAVTTVISPDHKTLLILTSGYNLWSYPSGPDAGKTNPAASTEWVFVLDVSGSAPVQKQAIPVPDSYSGIAFGPSGAEFYVSGGSDDNVHMFGLSGGIWTETLPAISLGHLAKANKAAGNFGGIGIETQPEAAGLAVSADGNTIVVANYENDAVSVLSRSESIWKKTGELDLRPGILDPKASTGVPGGEFPYWVQIKANDTAYVSSIRDREIDVVSLRNAPSLIARIKVPGQPNRSVLNKAQTRLFVAQDNSDSVAVIDTDSNRLIADIKVTAPEKSYPNAHHYYGANPNSVTLSPDEKTLYVTNGGENAVAVVRLNEILAKSSVAGLIPTGFYPNSVSTSGDGRQLFVVNGKSATGPDPGNCHPLTPAQQVKCYAANQYIWQLTKAGFQTLPTPADAELTSLTRKVILDNDHMIDPPLSPEQKATLAALHSKIHHVVYIIKENRTYDQVLGDLPVGNGDPSITQFPQKTTPNFHAIAGNFVDFDNFYDASDVSGDGWPWSTSARTTDTIEKEIPVNYANRGVNNNAEGTNRNVNVGIATAKERAEANPLGATDPNMLPGTRNVAAPDSNDDHDEQGQGYLWNAAIRAGLTLRNYGFFVDLARYNLPAAQKKFEIPEDPDPFGSKLQVAYSTSPVLNKYSDKYFRGFDNSFPDYFRFTEWRREFDQYEKTGKLPSLTLVRMMHDHFGDYSTAIDGVNTPELQIADNDYAVGLLIETIAHSKFKDDTLVFVIEDDAQDGGDHVDAHRSTAFIVGPYVKRGYVDSARYNTVSMLRTIEDILGIKPLNLNDAHSMPMIDAFDIKQQQWDYMATPSAYLAQTTLPIPREKFTSAARETPPIPLHDAAWWSEQCKGMDFSVEDHLDTAKFNRILWIGTMGDKPYPDSRSGEDLRSDRPQLLKQFQSEEGKSPDWPGGGRQLQSGSKELNIF